MIIDISSCNIDQDKRDILETAFDDSHAFYKNNPTQYTHFVLLSTGFSDLVFKDDKDIDTRKQLDDYIVNKWTGRFCHRLRHIIGLDYQFL